MMPTKSVWMSDDDELLWDEITPGSRSEIFRIAFRTWQENIVPKGDKKELEARLENLERENDELEEKYYKAECDFADNQTEMILVEHKLRKFDSRNLVTSEGKIYPEPDLFFRQFFTHAQKYLEDGTIFKSPSGQNRYRVHSIDIEKEQVFIERMDSKSPKPSSFTSKTVRKAVRRLSTGNDLKVGEFMPVLAQECAVVEIHPRMKYFETFGTIHYEFPGVGE